MNETKIEWCDKTLNPVVGCSFGCPYCYARRLNTRFRWVEDFSKPQFFPGRLASLKRKRPARVFMCSMSDPADWRLEWVAAIIHAIEESPQHEYLFLSKRPEEYTRNFPIWRHYHGDLKNIWYGASVTREDELCRIADLPLWGNRFVSFEPLLGPADPRRRPAKASLPWVDWAIIGAVTGPGAATRRPAREWVDEIVSCCDETGVPVFMKDSLLPIVGEAGMRRDFPPRLMPRKEIAIP